MLTPTSVNNCARRVSVYAGGRGRRAVRLRAAPTLPATESDPVESSGNSAATPILTLPQTALNQMASAVQGVSQSVSSAGSQTRSFLGSMLSGSPSTLHAKGVQDAAKGVAEAEAEGCSADAGVPLNTSSADSTDSASDVVSHNPFQSNLNLRVNTGVNLASSANTASDSSSTATAIMPAVTSSATPSALSSSSPMKGPMRRTGSVQFRLAEDPPVEPTPTKSSATTANIAASATNDVAAAVAVVPVIDANAEGLELLRGERSISMDSVEHDADTLSELPSISVKMRSMANIPDLGGSNSGYGNFGGNSIFNDIVNAPSGAANGQNSSGAAVGAGESGKYYMGSGYFDTENIAPNKEDGDSSSEDSLISDVNSDSSSDYEGA